MNRLALTALALSSALVAGCGKDAPRQAAPTGTAVPSGATVLVIAEESVSPRIDVVGTASSENLVTLRAQIGATVREVGASAGDRVKRGDVLIRLDDREVREQHSAALAAMKQAETELRRTEQLFENKVASDQALTTARSAYDAAVAQVERVKVLLTYAEILSPVDGIVTERRVEVGDLASPGQHLLSVFDPTHMRLEAAVPVRLVGRIAIGQSFAVTLDHPAQTVTGEVTEIVGEIDPASRTQKIKIRLLDTGAGILPGAFGRFTVEETPRPMILIPTNAVRRVGQLEFVSVDVEGLTQRRMVRTGPVVAGRVEVLSGLTAGDRLVVTE